jgi:putative toxin-antitoxin system antitoxin component (TIGR02293 family)
MSYMVDTRRIAEVLGVAANTIADLSKAVERGLPKHALRRTAQRVCVERGAARRLMVKVVPEATFKRRVRLSLQESERTERLARTIAAAEYAWDDRDEARKWLNTPHPELGGRTPLDCALTELGARRVENVLDRIVYGLPA